MRKWKELKSDERSAVILAQKLIEKENASLIELQKMIEVEDFLESRGLNSYDYNISKKLNFNEMQPDITQDFLQS